MAVKPIPDNYPRVIPYLIIKDVKKMQNFLKEVFDAKIIETMTLPDGSVNHGEVRIGDSVIMMGKASDDYPPKPAMIYVYVENVDVVFKKAISLGAKSIMEPADMFYGDRNGGFEDEQGMSWWVASHIKDISKVEMQKLNAERAKQK
jgi:PhnB protein